MTSHCCRCGFICSRFDNSELGKPSNETLLCVAFVSFLGWAALQAVVALIAKSDAMLGDCAAMVVDALTYGFNLYAERKKNEDEAIYQSMDESDNESHAAATEGGTNATNRDAARSKLERDFQRRRRRLYFELVPPFMSVSILLVVIGFVLHESIVTLILDANRSEREQSQPNLELMMTFSILNLLLDLVNVMCFARANHFMGYNTEDKKRLKSNQNYDVVGIHDGLAEDSRPEGGDGSNQEHGKETPNDTTLKEPHESEEIKEDERVNLNMCSAYTHVVADTLRSAAVIVATIVGVVMEAVTPEVADSTAAVIVSLIILFSLLPLFRGLFKTWGELRLIAREELSLSEKGSNDFELEMT